MVFHCLFCANESTDLIYTLVVCLLIKLIIIYSLEKASPHLVNSM